MICKNCGTTIPEGNTTCAFCGQAVSQPNDDRATIKAQATAIVDPPVENMVFGIVGAVLGAVLGAICIIFFAQIGYVVSISGAVLSVCTLKGYKLLGKHLSKKGIIICLILILITPFIAANIDWALQIMEHSSKYSLFDALSIIPVYIEAGAIEMSDYIINILMIYGFAALGAFDSIKELFSK